MISLARITLLREWPRFAPAVLAVGFAGLLVIMQLVLLLGIFRTVSVYIDGSSADLWVGYPGTPSVDLARSISTRNDVFLRAHPGVLTVEVFQWTGGDVRRPDGSAADAVIVGMSTRPDALTFARVLTPEQRSLLDEPDTVFVDVSNADNLGAGVGGFLVINGRRVKVIGLTHGLNNIGSVNIVTSLATARTLEPSLALGDQAGYLLVKLRDPADAIHIRDELAPGGLNPPYGVWAASEFSTRSQLYWLLETGLGLGFAFSSFIGLLIGIVITSQTLKSVVHSSLREYATLRALGVSLHSLRLVVLEQSAWVGLAGIVITAGLTLTAVHFAQTHHVLVAAPAWACAGVALFMLGIALGAGALALRTLSNTEPATLLR